MQGVNRVSISWGLHLLQENKPDKMLPTDISYDSKEEGNLILPNKTTSYLL